MKDKKLLVIVLVLVLLLGGAYALYSTLSPELAPSQISTTPNTPDVSGATEPAKSAAPDFTVYDLDGNPIKLSDFRGKPVLLNFWSSKCGPCRMEMPDFQKAFETYEDQVNFVMVNVTDNSWDTVDSASKFVSENGFTFPVFYDTDVDAASAYAVRGLPTTYFIDEEGYLLTYSRGMIRAETLQKGIDELLK